MITKDDCIENYHLLIKKFSSCLSLNSLYECSAYAGGYLRAMRDLSVIDDSEFLDLGLEAEGLEENAVLHINVSDECLF